MKLRDHLSVLHGAATRRVFKQFCAKYQFVYFGHVDARDDEHQLVLGVTTSTHHIDSHYTVGTLQGHDIILVQRRNTLSFPGKPSVTHRWLIMQLDLAHDGLPHIFINAHRYDETFYANLFTAHSHFKDVTAQVTADAAFMRHAKVFASPSHYAEVQAVLLPQVTTALAQHFNQFDYEINDDRLYLYARGSVVTMTTLQEMLRAGMWIADVLNAIRATQIQR